MHQQIDKKKFFLLSFLSLFFLTSVNNHLFIKEKDTLYNLKSIKVIGLEEKINLEIEQNLRFLKNTSIFHVDKEIIIDQISKYNFIKSFNVFKFYPSKLILELNQTEFLAQTVKNNKTFIIGSNGNFIDTERFNNYENLPIVYGKFNLKKFNKLINLISETELSYENISEIFIYQSGRIDIKTKDNLIIKFPLENIEEALKNINYILNDKKLKNNIIDLRISNQIIISNE
tara:strand:+ start:51 stop:740 length:690 start_codon:yes stop_codon:yes gene_type:complete